MLKRVIEITEIQYYTVFIFKQRENDVLGLALLRYSLCLLAGMMFGFLSSLKGSAKTSTIWRSSASFLAWLTLRGAEVSIFQRVIMTGRSISILRLNYTVRTSSQFGSRRRNCFNYACKLRCMLPALCKCERLMDYRSFL